MKKYSVYIFVGLCVLFWSGNFVLGRFVRDDVQPLELVFFRWLLVCVMLLPALYYVSLRNIIRLIRSHFVVTSVLAILSVTFFNTILYTALQTTTATNALLINSSVPIMILILSALMLKHDVTKRQVAGIALSTTGVLFLILKGEIGNIAALNLSHGDFWMLVSSLVWALYSVLFKLKPAGFSSAELFMANMYLGFVYLLPIYLVQGYTFHAELLLFENYWTYFIYVSLFASILSYIFWNRGIDVLGAAKTGQFAHLMPLFGAVLAYIFLGETLQFYHVVGAVLIGAGIYTSLFLSKPAAATE
ncbi:DMT family transporter [Sulfurimonas sp. HSL-3221]|uniref:DMT family transporter n=1 Tax=Thiomicrolovo sulfuroxydans TaxID=2894755 RepID=UPI001E3117B2|nr:DMT family transporter [Sulfurimonas sp. HSL-3221]UFS61884.1 DMT family transporter [Sulfurimonas sp. HSL-3221]